MKINVKYEVNMQLDIEMARIFGSPKSKKDIEEFYYKNKNMLKAKTIEFQNKWQFVAADFVTAVKRISHDYQINKQKNTGYLSIFDFNPRFLENHTFQVYYKHKHGSVFVTMHELLHFIFYDYTLQKFPDLFGKLDTEKGPYWDLAELFNSIILSDPIFSNLHGIKKPIFYPQHKKYLITFKQIWQTSHSIDKLIIEGLKIIS